MGKLQVAIALLPDTELANHLSAAALAAHAASHGRLRWPRLPPHLSLKQPFAIESLPEVEQAFDQLAFEVGPLSVTLGTVEVQPPSLGSPEAVVWVGVEADPALMSLEQRIERELSGAAKEAASPLVSRAYRFHVTLGFLPAASLGDSGSLPQLAGTLATFPELGLFVYDGLPRAGWQCMLYARRSLSRALSTPPIAASNR